MGENMTKKQLELPEFKRDHTEIRRCGICDCIANCWVFIGRSLCRACEPEPSQIQEKLNTMVEARRIRDLRIFHSSKIPALDEETRMKLQKKYKAEWDRWEAD